MIRLSVHAAARLAARNISLAWVEQVVTAPDRTTAHEDPALTQSFKAIAASGYRILKVVHRQAGSDILVVTAHFDRGAR